MLITKGTTPNILYYLTSSSDHITGKTGLGSTPTVTISKNSGAFAGAGGSSEEVGNGWYVYAPLTAETNTDGPLALHITGTGADPADVACQVIEWNLAETVEAAVTAALTAQGYTTTRAGKLDHLDVNSSTLLSTTAYAASLPGNFSILAIDGSGHVTDNGGGGGGGGITVDDILSASTALYTTPGTVGYRLNYLDATVSSRSGDITLPANFAAMVIDTDGKLYLGDTQVTELVDLTQTAVAAGHITSVVNPVTVGTNNDKSGYVLSNAQTFNLTGNISGSVGSVTGGVTVTTNNDKTGYALTSGEHVNIMSDVEGGLTAQGVTTARAAKLDHLDADVSSRMVSFTLPANFSTLVISGAGAVTAGTVSDKSGYSLSGTQAFNLTGNITGNLSGSVGSVTGAVGSVTSPVTAGTVSDKTGYALSSSEHTIIIGNVETGLTNQGYTDSRAVNLDSLDVAVSTRMASFSVPANFNLLVISGAGAVTAGTVSDKSGYSLSGTQSFNLTGNISGNLSGSVGSVSGNVGGNVGGSVASVTGGVTVTTNNDKTGYALSSATHTSIEADVTAAMGTMGYSSIRADLLDHLDAAVSTRMATFNLPDNFDVLEIDSSGFVTYNNALGDTAHAVLDAMLSGHTTTGSAGEALSKLVSVLPEDIAAAHSDGTLTQLLYEILAFINNTKQTGNTITSYRRDGVGVAATYTLDAPQPSQRMRTA
jgi:hypothetical protein